MNRSLPVLLAIVVSALGCGDSTGDPTGGGPAGGGPAGGAGSGDAFSIEVVSWFGRDTYDGASPQAGRRFVLVQQLLSNVSADAVSLNPILFSVETDTGIVVTISSSAIPDDICPGDASVTAGASFVCALLFEVPEAATPVTLSYEDPVSGLTASAQFGPENGPPPLQCSEYNQQPCRICVTGDGCSEVFGEFATSSCATECGGPTDEFCPCIEDTAGCIDAIAPLLACAAQQCASECGAE